MFRTKKDVDRHVVDILSKINSENEKNLRGYTFARLYFQAKDFESAKRYLAGFLKVRDHHAPAHKLMGQIHEMSQNLENALQSYKRSLEIDSRQNEVVLKICELYCRLPVDHETARYWAERAEDLYPHNEVVFKLRECLVSADGEADHQELEKLIATELQAQPKNISLRIRLLRLYLDTERLTEAYDHATMIESKRLFPWSVEWYYLLGDIFEAYQEECSQNLDSQFYIQYLTALDRLVFLTLAEPHSLTSEDGKKHYSVNDAAAVLLTFDQVLKSASEKDLKDGSWKYFIYHMKGQLYYYMTCLLLKRTKLDQGNRKEAFRFSSGLAVVCYTFKPMNLLQEIWFLQMDENQKAFTNFFQQGSLRTSFIGHIIMDMCKEDKSKWLQKLKLEVCLTQVKERIYSRVFNSVIQKDKLLSSYFILDSTFEDCSLEFPSEVSLIEYDKAAYKLCPDSLHHLVWFELHRQGSCGPVIDNLSEVFKGLQYSNKNLSKGSCESLCVLDLEAYLFASVYQSQAVLEKKKAIQHSKSQGSQLSYPPDIADSMCSKQQASWWRAAYGLHFCSVKEKFSEYRRELQRGLEVIRGIGNHGVEVQLVVFLARMFADKAELSLKNLGAGDNKRQLVPENVSALQLRSLHYWKIALGMLEKLSAGQTLGTPKEQMFTGFNKVLPKSEIKTLQEDGKLYVAVHLMNSDKLDDAAELLSTLSTPYGSYYLALTLKRLASQEEHFSKTRTALLSRAKNSVHVTMDRIKDDKSHPLNQELYVILEDVENELATDLTMSNSHNNEEVDEIDAYNSSPELNSSLYMSANSNRSTSYSTPRPSSKFMSTRPKSQLIKQEPHTHFEPSPERLDAQIRALTLNQDTFVKTFLDQQKSFLETNKSIAEALQQNTEVLEQLRKSIDELKILGARNQAKGSSRKHSYIKSQGDEEEYNAYESSLLDFYNEEGNEDYRASAYGYNPSSRMVHDPAAPISYVIPPSMPPGPPPALNHYNYQYPHHPVLPAPPVAERSPFYHPPPGQGLPFSEGQQLPQFHFHVASPVVKPTPPIMSTVASLPQGVTLPPPPPPAVHPPQSVIPPSAMSMPGPWSKTVSVPHAFQIPLPVSTPFPPAAAVVPQQTVTSVSNPSMSPHSDLKSLLKASSAQETISFSQNITSVPTPTSTTNVSIFAGICKTPEFTKLERSRCDSDNAGSPDIDGHDIEREVMGDFKPLIPLPAEIVVETGEENEMVLFEDRAKLYRFVDSEWKERGIGFVKILHDDTSGRVRLLMRRDQVLKVCANHYLTSNMEIQPLKSSDKAWTWLAQDFADEELRPEHFCIRFKTVELANAFKSAFDKALIISKESEKKKLASPHASVTQVDTPNSLKPFGANLFPKAGSWTCTACYVSNAPEKLLCVACETKKPGSQNVADSSSARTNPSEASSLPSVPNSVAPFVFSTPSSVSTDIFSSKSPVVPANTPKSTFGGFTFSSSPTVCETEVPEKDREILVVSTKSKNGLQVTKVNQLSSSPFSNFSFVKSPPTSATTSPALTVQFSDNVRNVSIKNATSTTGSTMTPSSTAAVKFSDKNASSVASSTAQSTVIQSANEGSLSKMASMVQNINPTYVFDKKDSEATNTSISDKPQITSSYSPMSKASGKSLGEAEPEEFVPTAEFKPVVPLPALVDLKTGEEEEETVFGERAKLFRYDLESKEWKERGIGELKILYQRASDKYRILMRRDVILKLCANHYILPEMKLSPLSNNEKSWVWFAQDYSDGDLKQEQFAARFKTTEIARKFHEVFQKCQSAKTNAVSDKASTDPCVGNAQAFDKLLKPATDSWECTNCHKSNMNLSSCVYCKTPKASSGNSVSEPVDNDKQKPLSEMFKPETGSWECQVCYVRNKSSNIKCASCESQRPASFNSSILAQDTKQLDSKAQPSLDKNRSLSDMFKPQPGSWECESCLVRNSADKTKCVSCETNKPGVSAVPSTESKPFGAFTFGSATTPNASPFTFGAPKANTGDFVFGVRPVIQPTTFSFGHSMVKTDDANQTIGFKPSLPTSNAPAIFGGMTPKQSSEMNNSGNSFFGNANTTKFDFSSFATPQKKDGEPQEFRFGSPQKYEFNFTGVRPRSPAKTPKSPRSPATPSDVDDEDADSDADNIYYTPAIPLPPEVEVKTGEEDEKTLFCKRAKLFRFSSGEWKERGIGDIKILSDEKTGKLRLLMRREQVLKVCLNHILTKDIKFEWRGDKSLSWAATDFSENEPSPELLAVRFKTNELANEFKSAITSALENTKDSVPQKDSFVSSSAASSFSFKTDTPKVETNFTSGSLSSRFGTSVQEKSLFGNSSDFSFSGSKDPAKTSPFSNIFKDKPAASSFFGSPNNSVFGGSKPIKDGVKFNLGVQAEEKPDPDVQVLYEATASNEQIEHAEKLRLPKNFYLYENKETSCPGCIGCTDTIPPYKDLTAEEPKADEALCLKKEASEQPPPPAAVGSNELFCNSKLKTFSFTELASTGTFENLTKSSPSSKNVFAGAGTPIFSNLNNSTEDGNEDVSQGPDIHFEPVIPLPDLVEVKTGEEDESELFVQRAKLFRYDSNTKQWKERGIGDIKILRHKTLVRFRIILRRDQVHNIACNHCISEEMSLTPLATSETALCWNALDFSDGKGVASQFAVRFKHKEQMNRFKLVFLECQEMLRITRELEKETGNQASVTVKEQSETISSNEVSSEKIGNTPNNETEHGTDEQNSNRGSEDEEDEEIQFEKRATLEIYDEATKSFKTAGVGTLKITYDDAVYGYHISMVNDQGKILCDHIIAVQTCLRTEGKKALWAAIELSSDPPMRRQFRASFCSVEAINEFQKSFEEGKQIAIESMIVEKAF